MEKGILLRRYTVFRTWYGQETNKTRTRPGQKWAECESKNSVRVTITDALNHYVKSGKPHTSFLEFTVHSFKRHSQTKNRNFYRGTLISTS